jgi:hypothetical protein
VERHGVLHELAVVAALALCIGCQNRASQPEQRAASRAVSSAGAGLSQLLAPPAAGRFVCAGDVCSQPYPRLPDSGEWRCAESGGVVWCAGGEPAAGVAPGEPSPRYRCATRFGGGPAAERVCVDRHPDYPLDQAGGYTCSFAQERGMTRVCKRATPPATTPLASNALPACWLGKDCRSGVCDRGSCRCATDQDCEAGRCLQGACAEAP